MRSRTDVRWLPLLAACGWLALAAPVSAAPGTAPTQEEVDQAIEAVKKDPNLAGEKSIRTLTWKGSTDVEPRRASRWPSWLDWIPQLFAWIGQASQMLVYVVIAALIGLIVLFIARLVRDTRLETKGAKFVAPTHVQDLDIRPESLPSDVGAAARALWEKGDRRAALALLYRGMLSRLAHVHEVAIRDSSTEGDCLALAARKLDAVRVAYVTQLVRTWQRFTYGGMTIDDATAHELCAGFAQNLDAPDTAAPGAARPVGAGA